MKHSSALKSVATLVLPFLFIFEYSKAADFTNDKCSKVLTHSGNIQISRDWDMETSNCFLSIHPMDVSNMTYRDYLFTNHGLIMIFNAYGDGPTSTTTGAREFYVFPRNHSYPDYRVEDDGDVTVKLISDHLIRFDSETFRIVEMSDAKISEDPAVNSRNQGGVEMSLTRGLLLDIGFTLGKSPTSVKDKKIMFRDSVQKTCSLKNRDLFVYRDENPYIDLNDAELKTKFSPRCPGLLFP